MTQPNTPHVDQVPGAEPETEEAKAAAAKAATETATETAEAATEAEKTATVATKAAVEAKAAAKAAAPPRTYSQEEWGKRDSAKDQEISQAKAAASQAAMQTQILQQQQIEVTARTKDQSDIDQGLITQEQATQRQQTRQVGQQRAMQEQQRASQMEPKLAEMGRMMAARDFGEKYGVSIDELLRDQSLTSPEQMETKAKQISHSKSDDEIGTLKARIKALEEGDPQFDAGQQAAGSSANLDELSPAELTAKAYSKGEVAKRAKSRNK